MTYARQRLPDKRESVTHKVVMGMVEFYVTVGLYPDGTPGEIFIKAGSINPKIEDTFGFQGWCDTVGELCSIILQAGVPLPVLCSHLKGKMFKPDGWTEEEHFAQSVPDYLGWWLMKNWGSDDSEIAGQQLPEPRED